MGLADAATKLGDLPKWQLVEHLVAILEQSLSPDAQVKHNEHLPELVTGTLRQCDVVIYSGSRLRRTITIVEVQDRNRKVGIQTYESWLKKREKLGVQHLICVSVAGFTQSVMDDAARQGEVVRLMTLCEADSPPPFWQVEEIPLHWDDISQRQIQTFTEESPDENISFSTGDKIFYLEPEADAVTLDSIIIPLINNGEVRDLQSVMVSESEEVRSYHIDFWPPAWSIHVLLHGQRCPLRRINVVERVQHGIVNVPVRVLAYEQRIVNGTLAWVVPGIGQFNGREIVFNIYMYYTDDGNTEMRIEHHFRF